MTMSPTPTFVDFGDAVEDEHVTRPAAAADDADGAPGR